MNRTIHKLAMIAALIAFCVIVLGAWVRLSHAGLGCPDWPGCYGQLTWPEAAAEIESANQAFPERPFESRKAWREMLHRYLAGSLMLLIFALGWMAWRDPHLVDALVQGIFKELAARLVGAGADLVVAGFGGGGSGRRSRRPRPDSARPAPRRLRHRPPASCAPMRRLPRVRSFLRVLLCHFRALKSYPSREKSGEGAL